jgi:voltage-gated potassium channel
MKSGRPEQVVPGHRAGFFLASFSLVAVVAVAVAGSINLLFLSIVLTAICAAAAIKLMFPKGAFFALTFVNLVAVYASVFAYFMEDVFRHIPPAFSGIGFSLPVLAFLGGCLIWREEIGLVIEQPLMRGAASLFSALSWLMPIACVGAGVVLLSIFTGGSINTEYGFLGAMSLVALIVAAVSRSVAVFLVDACLLFDEFSQRMSRLAVPAFAFLTFYSLLVIAFASVYCIISDYGTGGHFQVGTQTRGIGFSEAVHFSIVTISTVGYGDIVPASNLARVLASMEVVCGVMLLLFGVSELLEYTREHRHDRKGKTD